MSLIREITRLEASVRRSDHQQAGRVAIDILQRLETREIKFAAAKASPATIETAATRLAAAITQLLSNPDYEPPPTQVLGFIAYKRVLSQVFEVSGYRGTAHLRDFIRQGVQRNRHRLTKSEAARLLMGLSINAVEEPELALLKSLEPGLAMAGILAFLSEYLIWSMDAERARTWLLQINWVSERVSLLSMNWRLLSSTWMACSYADAREKHDIKQRLNTVVRSWLLPRGVRDVPARHGSPILGKERPTLLIVAELYRTGHAMDRCYRASIRSLRKYFRTVLMLPSSERGHLDETLFDEVDRTPFELRCPETFLHRAQSYAPAIAYFPSVGMRIAGIASANVRLAPIQIATNGHPATTRSSCVDYMILVDEVLGDPACFSETLLLRPSAPHYVRHKLASGIAPDIRRKPQPVRLAVPAWIRKLTPRFLQICSLVARRSSRPVEFWFFPNVRESQFWATRRRLQDELPARVFPPTSYEKYIANLNACDIHLSTFPFGSSNGIVDSVCQGLPVVNMIGPEPHSRLDAVLVRRLGQPEWLTVSTPEEYVQAVLRLAQDDALRVEISEAILAAQPESRLLVDDDAVLEDFADIFHSVYLHHESIRASGRKVWTYDELCRLRHGEAKIQGSG